MLRGNRAALRTPCGAGQGGWCEERRRCCGPRELGRIASEPRRQEQQLVDLVRWYGTARTFRRIEHIAYHGQQAASVARGARFGRFRADGSAADDVHTV